MYVKYKAYTLTHYLSHCDAGFSFHPRDILLISRILRVDYVYVCNINVVVCVDMLYLKGRLALASLGLMGNMHLSVYATLDGVLCN